MMRQPYWFAAATLLGVMHASDARAASTWDGGGATPLWSEQANWFPDYPPIGDVTIGLVPSVANAETKLDDNYHLRSLVISRGAAVINSTNGGATAFRLTLDAELELSNVFSPGSSMTIFGDGLVTSQFLIRDGSTLNLNSQAPAGMAIVRASGASFIDPGATLFGNGIIDFPSDGTGPLYLYNEGTLSAGTFGAFLEPPAQQLSIRAGDPFGIVSLDANGVGVVNVFKNATLEVDAANVDSFSGDLNLFTGSSLNITTAWTIDGGTVDVDTPGLLAGTGGPAAHLAGAPIAYAGGTMTLDSVDSLTIDAAFTATGGVINNSGTITFNAPATIFAGADFNMIGRQSKLVVSSNVNIDTPDFNLDGNGTAGNSTTINAGAKLDLDLGVGADDEFNHAINLNGGLLDVTDDDGVWSLGQSGVINASGPTPSAVNGDRLQVLGGAAINVAAGQTLVVNAPTQFIGNSSVAIGPGASLDFGTVTYNHPSATYAGAGTLHSGNATVADDTTWNVATVDLDDGNVTLNDNLTVNANSIDDDGGGFGATMVINEAARLTVNLAGGGGWTVDSGGTITHQGDLVDIDSYLAGSSIVLNGTLNNNGYGRSAARLHIGPSGHVNIAELSTLYLSGGDHASNPNTIAGGVIDGTGDLVIEAGRELRGFGTINAFIFGSGELRADDGVLHVNGLFESITVGTADADGILNVAGAWNTIQTPAVELLGGELRGAAITNDGANGIKGHGLVSAKLINNSRIDAEKLGTMILNNPANDNDWDGAFGNGQLNAVSADLELVDNASFPFTGTVAASDGHAVFANGFQLEFEPGSAINLTAGTYRSTESTRFGGNMTVHAGGASTLQIGSVAEFEGTSVTTLDDDLALDMGTAMIHPNAQFNATAPNAALVVVTGSVLQLRDGAAVGVPIENPGLMILGESFVVGQATAASYLQTAAGVLAIDLGGTGPNQHDALDLTGPPHCPAGSFCNLSTGTRLCSARRSISCRLMAASAGSSTRCFIPHCPGG